MVVSLSGPLWDRAGAEQPMSVQVDDRHGPCAGTSLRSVVHGDGSAARTLVEPMIADLLLDNAALVPLALLAVALLCVGVGWVLLRLPEHGHRALQVAAGVAALPVLGLTLVPSMKSRDGQ